MTPAIYCLLSFVFLLSLPLSAQTVRVPDDYPTIAKALASYGPGGPNRGKKEIDNVIEVTTFGPHMERFPLFGVTFADDKWEPFLIKGDPEIKPLILIRSSKDVKTKGEDGIVVSNNYGLVFQDLILSASPEEAMTPPDDLIHISGEYSRIWFDHCIVTALPKESINYRNKNDIPSHLLDGTGDYDPSLIRSGDDGAYVGHDFSGSIDKYPKGVSLARIHLRDTVWTQQGGYWQYESVHSPSGITIGPGGRATLTSGTLVSACGRDAVVITSPYDSELFVEGTPSDPIVFSKNGLNDIYGGSGVRVFGAKKVAIENAVFSGNRIGINYHKLAEQAAERQRSHPKSPEFREKTPYNQDSAKVEIDNAVFIDNHHAIGSGNTNTEISVRNSTFLNNEFALFDSNPEGSNIGATHSFWNCVIAGKVSPNGSPCHAFRLKTDSNPLFVNDSWLVTEGPYALAGFVSSTTTRRIEDDAFAGMKRHGFKGGRILTSDPGIEMVQSPEMPRGVLLPKFPASNTMSEEGTMISGAQITTEP